MSEPLTREQDLTYGELMILCEGHGTSQIYERHNSIVTALRAKLEACEQELEQTQSRMASEYEMDMNDQIRKRTALEQQLAVVTQERDALRQAGQP